MEMDIDLSHEFETVQKSLSDTLIDTVAESREMFQIVKERVKDSVQDSELFQYISAACEEIINLQTNFQQTKQKAPLWCCDKNIMRGKKLCSFIVFILSDYLTRDAISNIMPLFYEFVSGVGGKVTTIGGKRDSHKQFKDGPLEEALFDNPFGIYFDRNNNMLISEFGSHTVRIISPNDYVVKTIAGRAHEKGNEDGDGQNSTFWIPVQFCEERDGTYIVVDSFNNNYRRIKFVDGVYKVKAIDLGRDETTQLFNEVSACHDMFLDQNGDLIASDTCNHRIIKIEKGDKFVSYCGVPEISGYQDGHISQALWNKPSGVVVDRFGDIIVCDYQNHCVRKIHTKTQTVSTLAGQGKKEGFKDGKGSEALFRHPNAVCIGLDDSLFICDTDNFCIRQISTDGFVTTIAGTPGKIGSQDGNALESSFNYPVNLCVDFKGDLFIADWKNDLIRKFTFDY